jgi:hypothetical protein
MKSMIALALAVAAIGVPRTAFAGEVEDAVRMIGRVADAIDLARNDVAAEADEARAIGAAIEQLDASLDDKEDAALVAARLARLEVRLAVVQTSFDMTLDNLEYLRNTVKWLEGIAREQDSDHVWAALADARARLRQAFIEADDASGIFEKVHRAMERLQARLDLLEGIGG